MTRFQFAHCHLDYYPERQYCETVFDDGLKCEASPHDTDEYRQRASDLGYDEDTMLMCLHHEALHTILAEASGYSFSPTLRHVATDGKYKVDPGKIGREEDVVLTTQKLLMGMVNASRKS